MYLIRVDLKFPYLSLKNGFYINFTGVKIRFAVKELRTDSTRIRALETSVCLSVCRNGGTLKNFHICTRAQNIFHRRPNSIVRNILKISIRVVVRVSVGIFFNVEEWRRKIKTISVRFLFAYQRALILEE